MKVSDIYKCGNVVEDARFVIDSDDGVTVLSLIHI